MFLFSDFFSTLNQQPAFAAPRRGGQEVEAAKIWRAGRVEAKRRRINH